MHVKLVYTISAFYKDQDLFDFFFALLSRGLSFNTTNIRNRFSD